MLYSTQVSTKRETERALPFTLWEHFGLPERARLSYRSISMSFESSWYQQRRGANSQSITIKWKQSSCTFMINITQYSQHNIQIPLHSLILVSRFRDSETNSDRARWRMVWKKEYREIEYIEYISEEKNKFICKIACTHTREKRWRKREKRKMKQGWQ